MDRSGGRRTDVRRRPTRRRPADTTGPRKAAPDGRRTAADPHHRCAAVPGARCAPQPPQCRWPPPRNDMWRRIRRRWGSPPRSRPWRTVECPSADPADPADPAVLVRGRARPRHGLRRTRPQGSRRSPRRQPLRTSHCHERRVQLFDLRW